jgi:excisionase family DNA binding protein
MAEVVERLTVSAKTISRWRMRGLIKALPMGRKWLFPRTEVERIERDGISDEGGE